MTTKCILDGEAIERALSRMAHEILERTPADTPIGFVGIHSRGFPLAQRLARLIGQIEPARQILPVGQLDISFHRDDINRLLPIPKLTHIPFDIDKAYIILVDDVLYTGRSIRAALNALVDHGRAHIVRLAVLADRGHRQLPIRADYVGKNLPTASEEEVVLHLKECDGVDELLLKGGTS